MTFVSDDLDDDTRYEQKCPHGYIGKCVWCQRTEQVADGRTRVQRQEDHRRSVQKQKSVLRRPKVLEQK